MKKESRWLQSNLLLFKFIKPQFCYSPRYVTEIITDTIIKVIPGKVIPGYWKTVTVLVPKEITRTETLLFLEVTRTEVITVPKEVTRTETYTVPKEVTRTETYTVPREVTRTETYTVPYTHTYTDYETQIKTVWVPPVTTENLWNLV